jgi:hypothetical protein
VQLPGDLVSFLRLFAYPRGESSARRGVHAGGLQDAGNPQQVGSTWIEAILYLVWPRHHVVTGHMWVPGEISLRKGMPIPVIGHSVGMRCRLQPQERKKRGPGRVSQMTETIESKPVESSRSIGNDCRCQIGWRSRNRAYLLSAWLSSASP